MRAKDICLAAGVDPAPKHVEGARAPLKRMVHRQILTENEPGIFSLAPKRTQPSLPPSEAILLVHHVEATRYTGCKGSQICCVTWALTLVDFSPRLPSVTCKSQVGKGSLVSHARTLGTPSLAHALGPLR